MRRAEQLAKVDKICDLILGVDAGRRDAGRDRSIYQKHLTKADLAAITAFSPAGQKILKEMPAIMGKPCRRAEKSGAGSRPVSRRNSSSRSTNW